MNWFALTPLKDLPPPVFADLAGAQAWLTQARREPPRLVNALIEQLDRLQGAPLDGVGRAPILEALRADAISALIANRPTFADQPRPLPPRPFTAFSDNQRLLASLSTGYLQCLEEFAAIPKIDPVWIAVAAHRAMVGIKFAIEDHFLAGMEAPATLWQRAFTLVQLSQVLGVQGVATTDPVLADLGQSTVGQLYSILALTALSDPYGIGKAEYAMIQRLVARWRDLPTIGASRDDDDKKRWVNLRHFEAPAKSASKEPAWMEIGQVRSKLRKRIEALRSGESPEALHLGRSVDAAHALAALERLRRKLQAAYDPSRAEQSQLGGESIFLACGIDDGYSLITGTRYNVNPKAGAGADRVLNERMAIFGRHSVIQSLAGDKPKFGDEWAISAEYGDHLRIVNSIDSVHSALSPGMLVAFKQGDSFHVGRLTRAVIRQNGKMEVSMSKLMGEPKATDSNTLGATNQLRFPMLLLSAVPETKQPMIALLPSGAAVAPRQMMATTLAGAQQIQLGPVLDRGPNYDAYRVDSAR